MIDEMLDEGFVIFFSFFLENVSYIIIYFVYIIIRMFNYFLLQWLQE